jgi:hypothetical protein
MALASDSIGWVAELVMLTEERATYLPPQDRTGGISVTEKGRRGMSTQDDLNKKRTVKVPAETRRQEETGREDPTEPDEVGSAKETTTVRGNNEPQSVRRPA